MILPSLSACRKTMTEATYYWPSKNSACMEIPDLRLTGSKRTSLVNSIDRGQDGDRRTGRFRRLSFVEVAGRG
jgi:hypothetical protein